jgi:hypothetical protein
MGSIQAIIDLYLYTLSITKESPKDILCYYRAALESITKIAFSKTEYDTTVYKCPPPVAAQSAINTVKTEDEEPVFAKPMVKHVVTFADEEEEVEQY